VKPFYLSNRYNFETQLVPLHHGHVRIINEIAFSGTVVTIFWSWFVPVAFATMIRNIYRNDLRVVEKLRAAQKAKKFR
jgi:hypothetical protein